MGTLAKAQKDSAPVTAKAAEFMDIGCRAEAEVVKLQRAAIPFVLVAGAAFHLAKAEMPHGEWERYVARSQQLRLRTVQQHMQSVNHALSKMGYEIEPRAYETIVFASKIAKARTCALLTTPFAKQLIGDIEHALSFKDAKQLELYLGVRAPKKPLLPAARVEEDPEAVVKREIGNALAQFNDGLAMLQRHAANLSDADRAEVGWHCANHVAHMLPDGWTLHVHAHTGKEITLKQLFAEHLGLPEVSR